MLNIILTASNVLQITDGINPQINVQLSGDISSWRNIVVVRNGLFIKVYENKVLMGTYNLNTVENYQTQFTQKGSKSIFDTVVLPRAVSEDEITYYYDNVLKGGDEVLPDL